MLNTIKILKLSFVILFFFTFLKVNGQNNNYASIQKEITSTFPEINFSNKLLVLSIWNSNDLNSREMNKEIQRVYTIYQGAKLKDGLKGVVFVSISSDNNELQYSICRNKDLNTYNYSICDFKGYDKNSKLFNMSLDNNIKNIVYNSKGILVYQNLETDKIFKSFNSLLTR